jgi:hypothetical protein
MSTRYTRRTRPEPDQPGFEDASEHPPATRGSTEAVPEETEGEREGEEENHLPTEDGFRRRPRQFGIPDDELAVAEPAGREDRLTERLMMGDAEEEGRYQTDEEVDGEGGDYEADGRVKEEMKRGRLEQMEYLLEEMDGMFTEEVGSGEEASALEILMGRVLVQVAQPEIVRVKGGIFVRSIDQLVDEVKRVMGDDTDRLVKSAKRGGKDLVREMRGFNRKVASAMHVRPMLVAAVTMRLWMEEGDKRVRQMCMDTCQVMCRTDPREWDEVGKRLALGDMEDRLLTDESVRDLPGFERLSPRGKEEETGPDSTWTKMMLFMGMYLAYEPEAPITKEEAWKKWSVRLGGQGHHLCQKKNEKVSLMYARHRASLRELKLDLKRSRASKAYPDETDIVENYCLAVNDELRGELYRELRKEKVRPQDMTVAGVLQRLREAEQQLALEYWEPAGNQTGPSNGGAAPRRTMRNERIKETRDPERRGSVGVRQEGGQGGGKLTFSPNENRAMENYAKEKGLRKADVTLEMLRQSGGVSRWREAQGGSSVGEVKIPAPRAQAAVGCIQTKTQEWKRKYGVKGKSAPRVFCMERVGSWEGAL